MVHLRIITSTRIVLYRSRVLQHFVPSISRWKSSSPTGLIRLGIKRGGTAIKMINERRNASVFMRKTSILVY
jgi:hypothetical protein